MSNYRFELALCEKSWNNFIKKSENGTIFSTSYYLNALKSRNSCYYILKKNEIRAAITIIENEDGSEAVIDDLVIYNGLIFGQPNKEQNRAQRTSEKHRIIEFLAEELPNLYQSVEMVLHPSIVDIRPFQWYNYGQELPKYKVNIRFTSHLDISDFQHESKFESFSAYQSASVARRQEIRYGLHDDVKTEEDFRPDEFCNLYTQTIQKSGKSVAKDKLLKIRNLLEELHRLKKGKMFLSKTKQGGIGSIAFFVKDSHRAYYLFGTNNPDLKDRHTGTMVLWDAFYFLRSEGVMEIDLEGVNSPHRGWFKLSFGGDLKNYYEVSFKPKENNRN